MDTATLPLWIAEAYAALTRDERDLLDDVIRSMLLIFESDRVEQAQCLH